MLHKQTSAGQEPATEQHQDEYAEEQYQEEQHHEQEQPVYEEEPVEPPRSNGSASSAAPAEKDDIKFWSVNVRIRKGLLDLITDQVVFCSNDN